MKSDVEDERLTPREADLMAIDELLWRLERAVNKTGQQISDQLAEVTVAFENARDAAARPTREALAYSIDRAADIVGRSRTRIKKAIHDKEITVAKDGKVTMILRGELERWLDALPMMGRDRGY
jgi:hypothetical protein